MRRNLFNIPYGSSGAKFVDELAALIHGFTGLLPSKSTSWKAVCVACHVLLQKPTSAGSNATHSQHLERRLGLWRSGHIAELLEESSCIQQHLPFRRKRANRESKNALSDTTFASLVFDGKINSAIRYLSEDSSGGVLSMDDHPVPASSQRVRDILYEKHPRASIPPDEALLDGEVLSINPIIYESLTPKLIKDVARNSHGAAGPSGLDSEAWKRMATCF